MANDLKRGLKGLSESRDDYLEAERYYEGKAGEVFVSEEMREVFDTVGDNYSLTFAARPVDALCRRVRMSGVLVEGEEDGESSKTKRLQTILDAVDFEAEVALTTVKTAMYGDGYVLAWPTEDGDSPVDLYYNSPLAVRAIYDPENPRKILYLIKLWASGKHWRVNLYYPDRVERFVTKSENPPKDGKSESESDPQYSSEAYDPFTGEDDDGGDGVENHQYGLTAFHFRHGGDQYGVPAHRRAYGPQDAITKIGVSQMSSMEANAFPARVALEAFDREADLGEAWANEDPSFDSDDDDSIRDRRTESDLSAKAGTMNLLRNVASVHQFDPSPPDNFLKPLEFYIVQLAKLSDTPIDEVWTGGTPPSGVSRREAREAINSHARDWIKSLTRTWEQCLEAVCRLADIGTGVKVKVTYSPVEQTSDKEGWEVVGQKIDNGIPLRVALAEAGYPEELISAWYPDDAPAYSVAQLTKVASILQQLGQARTLGAISDAQIAELLPEIFGNDARTEDVDTPQPTRPTAVPDPLEDDEAV